MEETSTYNTGRKKLNAFFILVISVSMVLTIAIWLWYGAKIGKLEQDIDTKKSEQLLK